MQEKIPRRLTNFSTNYNRLGADEILALVTYCILFSPDVLNNRVFFRDTSSRGSTNKFLELSSVNSSMLVTENIVIGGQSTRIAKVMTFTDAWLRNNYIKPMDTLLGQRGSYQNASTSRIGGPARRPALQAPPRVNYGSYRSLNDNNSNGGSCCCCCTIL